MKIEEEIIKRVRNLTKEQQIEVLEMLRTWQSGKQREYQRLESKTNIDVVIGDKLIQSDSRDISASGLFINTSGKFETDKDVRVVFSIPGVEKPFKLQGVVVRAEKTGVAVRFENITPYFKKILDDVIWANKQKDEGL